MSSFRLPLHINALYERWRRPKFRPQCTHLTMSRLYGPDFVCDHCHRPGQFGWVYRCSQDREDVIDYALTQGYPSTFDSLGDQLVSYIKVRKRSRKARESSLSFFDEITPEQMTGYRPDQIATIIKQRDHVHSVIAAEQAHSKVFPAGHSSQRSELPQATRETDVWNEMLETECEYQICSHCRPGAADRAYLSLNAVADDEVMPSAATGFGFHIVGSRPILDARVIMNIGQRETSARPAQYSVPDDSLSSRPPFLDLFNDRVSSAEQDTSGDESDGSGIWAQLPPPVVVPPTRLKHSPRYENLSVFSDQSIQPSDAAIRPPWTPPPSPSLLRLRDVMDNLKQESGSSTTVEDLATRKREQMIQDLEQLYAMLGGQQPVDPDPLDMQQGVAILEESAEIGIPDIIKQA